MSNVGPCRKLGSECPYKKGGLCNYAGRCTDCPVFKAKELATLTRSEE